MFTLLDVLLPLAMIAVCIKPLGRYMARIYDPQKPCWLERRLSSFEHFIYRACAIDAKEEMSWRSYAMCLLILGLFGTLLMFAIFSLQGALPLNPQGLPGLAPDLAFNAAISFVTNTNWQSYSGETTLSYFSQAMGCVVQNFLSAATGMAVAVALFRSFCRKQAETIGNAWVDIVRTILYILLPLSIGFAVILMSQGVIQNFNAYTAYTPLEALSAKTAAEPALMAMGPVASQEAIKMLGSNGGGFFNTNSAHPFENPTPLSNLLQIVAILLIPASLAYTFGSMVRDRRQGWMLIVTMSIIFLPLLVVGLVSEQRANPRFSTQVVDISAGNVEGKETRFGVASSVLWAAATSGTSNGSVNAMHDSFQPMAGFVPLLLILFGEVVFGGVGSGMYGTLMFVLLTVFVGGLMVGRTPEYMGKKLGPYEIKMASLFMLVPAVLVLCGAAFAVLSLEGASAIANGGAQGFSEILYAFASAANNNGSAFAGLSANSPFYNTILGIAMFIGRYWLIVLVLAVAGSVARKNTIPVSAGTLPNHTPLFVFMLVGVIILLGILTYVPALALGPIAEHMQMYGGR